MKTNTMKNLLIGVFTTIVVMIGVGMGTNAQAQNRLIVRTPRIVIGVGDSHRRPHWDRFYERRFDWVDHVNEQREEGYDDGFEAGKKDAREGNDFEPVDQKKYIKASSYAYRRAFVCGYEDGYRKEMRRQD